MPSSYLMNSVLHLAFCVATASHQAHVHHLVHVLWLLDSALTAVSISSTASQRQCTTTLDSPCEMDCVRHSTVKVLYVANVEKTTESPAYSFSLKCTRCSNESLWTTVPQYILVAYGPLTVFLAVIVVFTVSVNSAPLRGWILVCQILSSNLIMRTLIAAEELKPDIGLSPFIQIFGSVYGVWNLDFFRSVYKSACLHPSLTTLQVLSLDYIIAAYPLVLIVVMYAMVELYSRNCRPMVLLGRLLPSLLCSLQTSARHQGPPWLMPLGLSLVCPLSSF